MGRIHELFEMQTANADGIAQRCLFVRQGLRFAGIEASPREGENLRKLARANLGLDE